MIQYSEFSTGGFVLHKIIINKRKYSAWYDSFGNLLSAELCLQGQERRVSQKHTNIRHELNRIGKRYVKYSDDEIIHMGRS